MSLGNIKIKFKVVFIASLLILSMMIYLGVKKEQPVAMLTEVNEEYFNLSSHYSHSA